MAEELPKTPFGTTDRIHINNLSMMHMHIYVYIFNHLFITEILIYFIAIAS